ncbi:MAG: hypothetical protein AAF718_10830 [Pseudomonadota bacterium]
MRELFIGVFPYVSLFVWAIVVVWMGMDTPPDGSNNRTGAGDD